MTTDTQLREHMEWCPGSLVGPDAIERLRFLVLAMAGEAGEAANVVKKQWRDGWSMTPTDWRNNLIDEIIDTAVYVRMLSLHVGFDLEAGIERRLKEAEQKPEYREWLVQRRAKT